jgi:hypothetical protein
VQPKAQGGLDMLLALAGRKGSGVKRYEYKPN